MVDPHTASWSLDLNALLGGLFLLSTFALLAVRQMQACVLSFVAQSLCLILSAFLLSAYFHSFDLLEVALIYLVTKPLLLPWLLNRLIGREAYGRREITQTLNIPTSLLIATALVVLAFFLAAPLLHGAAAPLPARFSLPIGFAGILLGGYTVMVRREAVAQLLGILAIENAAFFAGIATVPTLPLIAEVAAVFDILIIGLIMGLLTRAIQQHIGTTEVASLTSLREGKKGQS